MRAIQGSAVARGIGKRDYTDEVGLGQIRPGITLHAGEGMGSLLICFTDQVVHPYILPWIVAPLAPGASAHLINPETGIVTLTVPQGYILIEVQYEWTNSEDIEMWHYVDTLLWGCSTISPGGDNKTFNPVIMLSTAVIDPTGEFDHVFDVEVINNGLGDLEGIIAFNFILEEVGTPPLPLIKDCRCPFCNHIQTVPVGTTRITCSNCGKLYMVWDLSRVRRI